MAQEINATIRGKQSNVPYEKKTVVLGGNMVGERNILTQDMLLSEDTKYIIRWAFDLDAKTVIMPAGSSLEFNGGSINNGTIVLNDTPVYPSYNMLTSGSHLTIEGNPSVGTYNYTDGMPVWWNGSEWKRGTDLTEEVEQMQEDIENLQKNLENFNPSHRAPIVVPVADEEDITVDEPTNTYKFKDKAYAPALSSGLGRKYLRKNITQRPKSTLASGSWVSYQAGTYLYLLYWHNGTMYNCHKTGNLGLVIGAGQVAEEIANYRVDILPDYAQDNSLEYTIVDNLITITLPDETTIAGSSIHDVTVYEYWENVDDINLLTQEMVSEENTVYVIQYDYILKSNITIPANCMLKFEGGSISGGYTVTGQNTGIQAGLVKIFNTDVILSGSWNVTEAYPEWFGAKGDYNYDTQIGTDDSVSINKAISFAENTDVRKVRFSSSRYYVTNALLINTGGIIIEGNFGHIKENDTEYNYPYQVCGIYSNCSNVFIIKDSCHREIVFRNLNIMNDYTRNANITSVCIRHEGVHSSIHIEYTHIRGYLKAVHFASNDSSNYVSWFFDINNCSFYLNDYVIFMDDANPNAETFITLPVVSTLGFQFRHNRLHGNGYLFRGGNIYAGLYIEDCNLEGPRNNLKDGTSLANEPFIKFIGSPYVNIDSSSNDLLIYPTTINIRNTYIENFNRPFLQADIENSKYNGVEHKNYLVIECEDMITDNHTGPYRFNINSGLAVVKTRNSKTTFYGLGEIYYDTIDGFEITTIGESSFSNNKKYCVRYVGLNNINKNSFRKVLSVAEKDTTIATDNLRIANIENILGIGKIPIYLIKASNSGHSVVRKTNIESLKGKKYITLAFVLKGLAICNLGISASGSSIFSANYARIGMKESVNSEYILCLFIIKLPDDIGDYSDFTLVAPAISPNKTTDPVIKCSPAVAMIWDNIFYLKDASFLPAIQADIDYPITLNPGDIVKDGTDFAICTSKGTVVDTNYRQFNITKTGDFTATLDTAYNFIRDGLLFTKDSKEYNIVNSKKENGIITIEVDNVIESSGTCTILEPTLKVL